MACRIDVILGLKPGDEIMVKAGYGYPELTIDTKHIVADVQGLAAVTATGVLLKCSDGEGVKRVGVHHKDFEISPKAKRIMARARSQN